MQVPEAVSIEPILPETAVEFLGRIPEFTNFYSLDQLQARLYEKPSLILGAFYQNNLLGVKLGYALSSKVFYSWLGGVKPGFRRQRIARSLGQAQEAWALGQGFGVIRVKTRNRHRPMLHYLVSQNYDIVEVEVRTDREENRIIFEKKL